MEATNGSSSLNSLPACVMKLRVKACNRLFLQAIQNQWASPICKHSRFRISGALTLSAPQRLACVIMVVPWLIHWVGSS
ncbi:hypothetical protein BD309DRAFT_136945 [Dichomitus squalens]|nr:hypothetical protein BD309DRAFT_136945 [Dichomitus squalens]